MVQAVGVRTDDKARCFFRLRTNVGATQSHVSGTAGTIARRYHAKQIHTAKDIEALRVSYVLSLYR